MSCATYLTLLRVVISPLFLLIYAYNEALGITPVVRPFILLLLWGISELSDAFDGFLARRMNQVTDLGKILDPMADSLARISAFLTFTLEPVKLPLILVLAFMYRDFLVSTLRTVCALKGFALAARMSGKVKAVIQATVICLIILLMIPHAVGLITTETLRLLALSLTGVAALYTVISGIEYFYVHRSYVQRMLEPLPKEDNGG
jgi:CDP-diacylglycerol--glycerol-3-phosphate 3-phosphatidyltransferase